MAISSVKEIEELFRSFAWERDGALPDVYSNEDTLFAKCVLPKEGEVAKGDTFRSGVAVSCVDRDIEVRPFLLRQVCVNGAIRTASGAGAELRLGTVTEQELVEAFATCASEKLLADALSEFRLLQRQPFDMVMMMTSFIRTHARTVESRTMIEIVRTFMQGGDRSSYGFMNAITRVARDAQDPARRWQLQKLGGFLPAWVLDPDRRRQWSDALEVPVTERPAERELQPA